MPQQARLDVFQLERLLQQRIVVQINLADGQIIGGAPIGVHLPEEIDGQGLVRKLRLVFFTEIRLSKVQAAPASRYETRQAAPRLIRFDPDCHAAWIPLEKPRRARRSPRPVRARKDEVWTTSA